MNRIIRTLVRINHPFRLADQNWTYPAGEYELTTEEEELGGGAYRRLRTIIYITKSKSRNGIGEFVEIGAGELDSIIPSLWQPARD